MEGGGMEGGGTGGDAREGRGEGDGAAAPGGGHGGGMTHQGPPHEPSLSHSQHYPPAPPPSHPEPRNPFMSPLPLPFGGPLALLRFQNSPNSTPPLGTPLEAVSDATLQYSPNLQLSPGNLQLSIGNRAFAIYQERTRPGINAEFPSANNQWVESIISQRWSLLTEAERQRFYTQAQSQMVAMLSDPTGQKQRRRRRSKEEIEREKLFKLQFKRKRGRPSREEVELRRKQLEEAGLPVPDRTEKKAPLLLKMAPAPETEGMGGGAQEVAALETPGSGHVSSGGRRRGRRKKEAGGGAGSLLGKTVEGIFDGTFDAGYFVTLKVANTELIFRGVVFGPAKAVVVNKGNDVAPGAKYFERLNIPFPDLEVRPSTSSSRRVRT